MKPNLVIVGNGSFAKAIVKEALKQKIDHSLWPNISKYGKKIILYCGSGNNIQDVIGFCNNSNTPLILLSTNIKIIKDNFKFPFLFIPNASEEVRSFIDHVVSYGSMFAFKEISIIESHQQSKKDVSGTALVIAKKLNKTKRVITSIRNVGQQIKLGIPKNFLNGHAYHKVIFKKKDLENTFSVLILGRESYAKGVIKIAKDIMKNKNI